MSRLKYTFNITLLAATAMAVVACAEIEPTPAPTVYIAASEYEIAVDSTLELEPQITYDYNSTYQWWLNGAMVWDKKDYSVVSTTPETRNYTFIVSTPEGSDTCTVKVQSMYILTFEEYKMDTDSVNYGQTGTTLHSYQMANFPVLVGDTTAQWTGFALSAGTSKATTGLKIRYSACTGNGSEKSKNYLVLHQPENGTFVEMNFAPGENHTVKSIDINNTTYLYNIIKSGVTGIDKFAEGDWYVLTIEGIDSNGTKTGEVQTYLADYRNKLATKRKMVEAWTTLATETLGKVNRLRFTLTSSDTLNGLMVTPGYFCLDNIKVSD